MFHSPNLPNAHYVILFLVVTCIVSSWCFQTYILKIAKSAVFGGQQCFEKYNNMGQQAELRWSNKLMPLGIGSWLLLFIHCTILLLHVPLKKNLLALRIFFLDSNYKPMIPPYVHACAGWFLFVIFIFIFCQSQQ